MSNYKEKVELFENILNHKIEYSINDFRKLCAKGIPENAHIKATSWKILLNYISLNEYNQWESQKNAKRKSYYDFVKELIIEPSWEEIINAKKEIVTVEDHPLNEAPTSKWSTYFSELTVLEQIDKDARRTLPDIGFFQFPIKYNEEVIKENKKLGNVEPFLGIPISKRRSLFSRLEHKIKDDDFGARSHKDVLENQDDTEYDLHWEALERILFIYAKLNPGIGYIQGMNEVLGPLYYVLANDIGVDKLHAEADAFYLFTNLMSIFRDHFIRNLDSVGVKFHPKNEMTMENIVKLRPQEEPQAKPTGKRIIGNETGIGQSMLRLYKRIELRDKETYMSLRQKKILPAYFAFRWLSVLLTQEFNLPDIIRIWDSLFSDINLDILGETQMENRKRDGKFDFLIEFCCAMIMCVRRQIIKGNSGDIIKLLQNYPIQDVNTVLQVAYRNFDRPLRPRITPEQIQQRQEYLKQKRLQQQQAKTNEVTNQIKNSINTLETKLQSLDFSKMFNQVSEKINSITSPITDKPYSYFDDDNSFTKESTSNQNVNTNIENSNSNQNPIKSSNKNTNNNNNQQKNLQRKASLSALASNSIADLNTAYENASVKISGWFKSSSSALTNALNNFNNIMNSTDENNNNNNNNNKRYSTGAMTHTMNSNNSNNLNGNIKTPKRNSFHIGGKQNSTNNSNSRIQSKLSESNENVPIMKSAKNEATSTTTQNNTDDNSLVNPEPTPESTTESTTLPSQN